MALKLEIQTLGLDVEGVGVLHHELAHPQQPGLGPRLVPELGLELVPDLGQLSVGAQLPGDPGEDLLVGHAEAQVGSVAVLEPEQLFADSVPAPGFLPDLRRVHGGQLELLPADAVHLIADDSFDLVSDSLSQWE